MNKYNIQGRTFIFTDSICDSKLNIGNKGKSLYILLFSDSRG